jgi:ribose transport system permease protein
MTTGIIATTPKDSSRLRRFLSDHADQVLIFAILGLIIGVSAALSEDFRTPQNAVNVLRQAVALGIIAIGQTVVILNGGIDLSVGSAISLVAVIGSGLMNEQPGFAVFAPAVVIALGIALLVGLANGVVITLLRVTPFIATLSVASIVQGILLLYTKQPVGGISPEWAFFAEGTVGPLPFPVLFLAALVIVTHILLTRTVLGRHIIATGADAVVARLSGIRTRQVTLFAYMFCSMTAGVTGLYLISRMGIGDPQVGGLNFDRFDLDSIAAVLIGGTRLSGGKGAIIGTVAGVLIVATLNNIFNLVEVSTFYQWIIKGLIIIGAVAVYTLRGRAAERA